MRALEFILRRLLTAILVLIGVSVITFFISHVVPTDTAALYLGSTKARPEDLERIRIKLGLDRPLPVQYVIYMGDLLRGDLGDSIATKRPVLQELTDRLPATLELLFVGMFIATLIGIPLGRPRRMCRGRARTGCATASAMMQRRCTRRRIRWCGRIRRQDERRCMSTWRMRCGLLT